MYLLKKAFLQTEMTDFATLSYAEAWKRYPSRAGPPCIGNYREKLRGGVTVDPREIEHNPYAIFFLEV